MTPEQFNELLRRIDLMETCLFRIVKGLTTLRAATIMDLGCIEDSIGYERTITPKRERQQKSK